MAFAVSNMLSITAVIGDLVFQLFLFLTLIYLLVDKEQGVIDLSIKALPTNAEVKQGIRDLLQDGINGILVSTVEGAAF